MALGEQRLLDTDVIRERVRRTTIRTVPRKGGIDMPSFGAAYPPSKRADIDRHHAAPRRRTPLRTGLQSTLRWRRQSRANSSLEQANVDGQMTRGPGSIERNFGTTLCTAEREGTDNNFE